jgi:hypothetical protein
MRHVKKALSCLNRGTKAPCHNLSNRTKGWIDRNIGSVANTDALVHCLKDEEHCLREVQFILFYTYLKAQHFLPTSIEWKNSKNMTDK